MTKTLANTNTIGGVAGTAGVIAYSIEGDAISGTTDAFGGLPQGFLGSSAATLFTAASQALVGEITLVNTSASPVSGIKLFKNGLLATNQILGSLTLAPGGMATIGAGGTQVIDSTGATIVPALTFIGDVTGSGSGTIALTIAAGVVDNSKLANMAQATFKMRAAGAGTGAPIDGTAAQAKTALAIVPADVAGFDTQVRSSRLDQMAAPGADVPFAGFTITGIRDGVASTDPASFGQLTAAIQAQKNKAAADWSTTANITLSGLGTQAGGEWTGTLAVTDRILVKNQTLSQNDGIYNPAAGAWVRTTDTDTAAEITHATVGILQGATLAGDIYNQSATVTTLGTDAQTWIKISEGNTLYAADGTTLQLVGTTFSVKTAGIAYANIQDQAQATFLMRAAGAGTGPPIAGTPTQAKTALAIANTDVSGLGTASTKNVGNTVLDPGTGKLEFAMPSAGLVTGTNHTYVATDRGFIFRRSNAGVAMSDTLPALTNTTADIGWTVTIHNQDTVIAGALTVNASGGALFLGGTGVTAATSPVNFGCRQTFVWDGTQWLLHAGNADLLRRSGTIVAGNFPQFLDTAGNIVTDSGVSAGSFVPVARAVTTTAPLEGGGPLSADLSLTIDAATATTPGTQSAFDYNRVRKEFDAYADFGLVGDLRTAFEITAAGTQVVMTSGSNVVNIPNAGPATPFVAGRDEGKRITVTGAGPSGAQLTGVIGVVSSSTSCTVLASVGGAALNASTTVTASTTVAIAVQWGTDNTTAIAVMVAVINGQKYPCPKITFGHAAVAGWTHAWGFPVPVVFNKPVWLEGIGGSHTCDVGDYTKTGGTRLAWWGTSSDGGTLFGAMFTIVPPAGATPTPTFVQAQQNNRGLTTSAIGTLAHAPADGNMLIAVIALSNGTAPTVTPPTGWTLLSGPDLPSAGTAEFYVYWKPAASEGTTWTWGLSANRYSSVNIEEITGVRTDVAPQVAVAQNFAGTTTGNTPSVSTTSNGEYVLGAAAVHKTSTSTPVVFTQPGSTTLDAQGGSSVALAPNVSTVIIHDTVNQAAAGATTVRTITAGVAPTGGVTYTVTIAPSLAASGVQAIKRPKVSGCWFDCRNGDQNQALFGLKLASCHGAMLDDGFFVMDALAQGLWCDISTGTVSEAADMTRFDFGRLCFRQLDNSSLAPPTTTPTTTTFTSALTTVGQAMTLASGTGFSTTGGYAWVMTNAGNPVLIHYTGTTGATLNGCTVAAEDVVFVPTPVSGSFVVPCTPSNGGAMKFSGGSGHNTCCGTVRNVQISYGTTWGPAAIECLNSDTIHFIDGWGNGGSDVTESAINRKRRPGLRFNGSNVSATLASRNHTIDNWDPGGAPGGPQGGVSVMGLTSTGALLVAPSNPNYLNLQQMGNGAPVPTVETGAFLDWNGNGMWRAGAISTGSVAAQTLTAAVGNIVTGSVVVVPPQGWQIGTRLRWVIPMHKTAVGTSWSAGVRQNSALTVGTGTLIATVTYTATAVVDGGCLEIELVCTSLGAAGTALGQFVLTHDLTITGLSTGVTAPVADATAVTGTVRTRPTMAAFNTAMAGSGPAFLWVEINPITAATVMTIDPPAGAVCLKPANP